MSHELKVFLQRRGMDPTRSAPPDGAGKIERYRRLMTDVVRMERDDYPWQREHSIQLWVEHNNQRISRISGG